MEIKMYMSFDNLKEHCWSGAIRNLEEIEEAGLEDELMFHLEEVFCDETPTITQVNDYLWFDASDFVLEHLTMDNINSLEELKGYSDIIEADNTIDEAIKNGHEDYLLSYLQENYGGDSLREVIDGVANLEKEVYLPASIITCFDDFAKYTDDEECLDILKEVSNTRLEKEFYDRFKSEYIDCGSMLLNFLADLPYFDIEEL